MVVTLHEKKAGFSLVELAIVLVIIGLITGGILTGQELIRSSELNNVVSEYYKWNLARDTFKLKYNALPGDLRNAQSYWGVNAGCATSAAGTGTQTCNGDGDGFISERATGSAQEQVYFWQHLANAGLIPGSYTGVSSTYYTCTTANCPTGKMTGSFWAASAFPVMPGTNGWWWNDRTRNLFMFGSTVGGGYVGDEIMTPAEAFSIDKKVDDGIPGLGKWMSFGGPNAYNENCVINGTNGAALTNAQGTKAFAPNTAYNLSNNSVLCGFQIYWEQ